MSGYKAILLDFDGVLVDSVGIKDKAFERLFTKFPEHFEKIMAYHLNHNAVIRFDKFRYIYEIILSQEYTDDIRDQICQRYSDLVVKNIIACSAVAGSVEFLRDYSSVTSLYLVSINPLEELMSILRARKIDRYFKDIYAYPWKKADAIKDILSKENISAEQALFIGDSPEDRVAAEEVGVSFMGRDSGKNIGGMCPIYTDFYGIRKALSMQVS